MLPLQIHPIKLLMKSINHDLAFNASAPPLLRSHCVSRRLVMSFHGGDVGTIMKATINSNRRPALSIKHSTFIQATVYQHLIKTGGEAGEAWRTRS
uniref:Uncharacterized protein n=1 Tax=Brassica campestris TaxID=3711 RepID=A0A3P5YV74_BRACM|nr:unnamed protein product [Brassica rapa]